MNVLNVVMNLRVSSGVSTYAMNYFRAIDRKEAQIDFMEIAPLVTENEKVVWKNGGKIYNLPSKKNLYQFTKAISRVFQTKKYDIVHVHIVGPSAAIILRCAKKNGVKVRIFHAHMTGIVESIITSIKTKISTELCCRYATDLFACSTDAGKQIFGEHQFYAVKNGVDIEKFAFSPEKRSRKRKELDIKDEYLIGTVCRTVPEKNPYYLLDIVSECRKINKSIRFIWVGSGLLDQELKEYAKKIKIDDITEFLGSRSDTAELYQALDAFLMPSLHEGLGIVYIEAQIAGLPTYASDVIPRETAVTDLIHYLSLNLKPKDWAKVICSNNNIRGDQASVVKKSGFDIQTCANKLLNIYHQLMNKRR